jgi:hypothetical protein
MIAFTLFTSLSFAVLAGRLGNRRSAAAASSALGLALATGLLWWESVNNFSLLALGPVAVGFAAVVIATVIFGVFRRIGGSVPAAFLSLGSCLLIAWSAGLDWLIDSDIVAFITLVMIITGLYMIISYQKGLNFSQNSDFKKIRNDLEAENQSTRLGNKIQDEISSLYRDSSQLENDPQAAKQLQRRIEKILPQAEALTDKMAELRRKAFLVKNGDLNKLKQLRIFLNKTPPNQRSRVLARIKETYKQLNFDQRIERLDYAVAETEKQIRETLNLSIQKINQSDIQGLNKLLKEAEKLQRHNAKLLSAIQRSENKLLYHLKKHSTQVINNETQ